MKTHWPQTEMLNGLGQPHGLRPGPRAPTFLPRRPELDARLLKGFLQLCAARLLLLQGQLQLIVLQRNLCGQSRVLFPSTK